MTEATGVPEDLPDEIRRGLEELAVAGFTVTDAHGSGTVNRVLVARSDAFAVRVTADRGEWWVDAGPLDSDAGGGSDWFDAELWAVCSPTTSPPLPPSKPADHVRFFLDNREVVAMGARDDGVRGCLLERRRRRARERLGLPPE